MRSPPRRRSTSRISREPSQTAVVGRFAETRLDRAQRLIRAANTIDDWAFLVDAVVDVRWYGPRDTPAFERDRSQSSIVRAFAGVQHNQRFHRAGDLQGFDDPTGRVVGGIYVTPWQHRNVRGEACDGGRRRHGYRGRDSRRRAPAGGISCAASGRGRCAPRPTGVAVRPKDASRCTDALVQATGMGLEMLHTRANRLADNHTGLAAIIAPCPPRGDDGRVFGCRAEFAW